MITNREDVKTWKVTVVILKILSQNWPDERVLRQRKASGSDNSEFVRIFTICNVVQF